MGKRVGVFGGSFDPVHQGHLHIVHSFLDSGLIDEILITLTPDPPHKKDRTQAPYNHRLKMLQLAFSDIHQVRISDLEQSLPKPSYTLQTIRYLKSTHPENIYFLCMGEDSLVNFHEWYRYKELLDEVTLLAARRPGYSAHSAAEEILEKTIFVNNRQVDISSTEIRSETVKRLNLPVEVEEYIRKQNLY